MKKKILLLSAYHAQSHAYWCQSLITHLPEFEWTLLSLPARYFSWRIRGNALSFMADFSDELEQQYDLCICTSMVDVATVKAIIPSLSDCPFICYFHENQFAYPSTEQQNKSLEPKMVNLYSALAADKVLFNSNYNQQSFYQGIEQLMAVLPDKTPDNLIALIQAKAAVLPVPLENQQPVNKTPNVKKQLLWNHRWEYDKGPDLLAAILLELEQRKLELDVCIIGQQFRQQPKVFNAIKLQLENSPSLNVIHWGFIEDKSDYQKILMDSDFVLSTADHDFQGLAILEAVAFGATPVLPQALVYPEWFDKQFLYAVNADVLVTAVAAADVIERLSTDKPLAIVDTRFLQWLHLKNAYQALIHSLL